MADGNSKQEAGEVKLPALPLLLKEAAGEEVARKVAEISGADLNSIWMVDPSITELQDLIVAAGADGARLIQAYVRTHPGRKPILSVEQIESTPWRDLKDVHSECRAHFLVAYKEVVEGPGKRLEQMAETLNLGETSS